MAEKTPKTQTSVDISTLETWLWDAACSIRGAVDANKYKEYILPLLFFKRLSDVYADEIKRISQEIGDQKLARDLAAKDRSLTRVYIPEGMTWDEIRSDPTDLGDRLTTAVRVIARENPDLKDVIDISDYNATTAGQRILPDGQLAELIEILSRYQLGLREVEPDILGRAYEYLIRKFAEGSGQSAGEFYTPMSVALLMSHILDPQEGETLYDPACGSGGLLIKAQLRLRDKIADKEGVNDPHNLTPEQLGRPLQLYGQERENFTYAMGRMNAFIHDMDAEIAIGDTIRNPQYTDNGQLRTFTKVTANPMWNQEFPEEVYETDPYNRFTLGTPPSSSADWGWIQHMEASLAEGGRMAVVLDTGSVSRGSGNKGSDRERDIRAKFVEQDMVEAVILLPENLFYNTSAPGIILVINKSNPKPGEILLINASQHFEKGKPKNFLAEEHITEIAEAYLDWQEISELSTIVNLNEVAQNDYNISPSRYVVIDDTEPVLPLEEAFVLLKQTEESHAEADEKLKNVLRKLGYK